MTTAPFQHPKGQGFRKSLLSSSVRRCATIMLVSFWGAGQKLENQESKKKVASWLEGK
jgi:hypothetical protein